MTNEEIKIAVSALFPSVTYDETGEFLTILVSPAEFRQLMEKLRNNKEFSFDFLFCLTCIDWKTHFMMVYHLLSRAHRHNIVVKAKLADINAPQIDTVCDIWRTANFHEREVYDLFGVRFMNHPDLRRLLLDENWEGHPLRKNYVDENMITI
jgi:NADH/F420H2 dehydrogenase subunit C